ncbi:MAG: hypothetical protein K5917_07830 [Clostridiales bacterium]|nr:hypothetical protein [Clostridiales bacterium]
MKKVTKIVLSCIAAFFLLLVILFAIAWKVYLNPRVVAKPTIQSTQSTLVQSGDYPDVKYIAHRGFSAVAPENTLPAVIEAGKAGFYGAECDVYRTKDGKWVIMHDPYLFRMTDGFWKITNYTYDELLQFNYDNGANYENYPNLKITLLSDWLDECKKYNLTPCVEIKNPGTDHLDELVLMLNQKGFGSCPILSFKFEQLQEIRKYSNQFKIWYLVHHIEQDDIDLVKTLKGTVGIDFNGNSKKNDMEAIARANAEGVELGAWTIDTIESLDKMISNGVKYITTNTILPE